MFLMGVLATLGALYCGTTYYINRVFIMDAFGQEGSVGARLFCGAIFLFSPITIPIGLVILILMNVISWLERKEDESFPG